MGGQDQSHQKKNRLQNLVNLYQERQKELKEREKMARERIQSMEESVPSLLAWNMYRIYAPYESTNWEVIKLKEEEAARARQKELKKTQEEVEQRKAQNKKLEEEWRKMKAAHLQFHESLKVRKQSLGKKIDEHDEALCPLLRSRDEVVGLNEDQSDAVSLPFVDASEKTAVESNVSFKSTIAWPEESMSSKISASTRTSVKSRESILTRASEHKKESSDHRSEKSESIRSVHKRESAMIRESCSAKESSTRKSFASAKEKEFGSAKESVTTRGSISFREESTTTKESTSMKKSASAKDSAISKGSASRTTIRRPTKSQDTLLEFADAEDDEDTEKVDVDLEKYTDNTSDKISDQNEEGITASMKSITDVHSSTIRPSINSYEEKEARMTPEEMIELREIVRRREGVHRDPEVAEVYSRIDRLLEKQRSLKLQHERDAETARFKEQELLQKIEALEKQVEKDKEVFEAILVKSKMGSVSSRRETYFDAHSGLDFFPSEKKK